VALSGIFKEDAKDPETPGEHFPIPTFDKLFDEIFADAKDPVAQSQILMKTVIWLVVDPVSVSGMLVRLT
jgi:hypothetical protein